MYTVVNGRRFVVARESHMPSLRILFSDVEFINVPDGLVDIVLVVYRQEGGPNFDIHTIEKILGMKQRDPVLVAALLAHNELRFEEVMAERKLAMAA